MRTHITCSPLLLAFLALAPLWQGQVSGNKPMVVRNVLPITQLLGREKRAGPILTADKRADRLLGWRERNIQTVNFHHWMFSKKGQWISASQG